MAKPSLGDEGPADAPWRTLTSGTAQRIMRDAAVKTAQRAKAVSRASHKPRPSDRYQLQPGTTSAADGPHAALITAAAAALERNAGTLRREAAVRLRLRFVPRLQFHLLERGHE